MLHVHPPLEDAVARLAIGLPGDDDDNLSGFLHSFKILNGFLEALILKLTPECPLPMAGELPRAGLVDEDCRNMS